MKNIPALRFKEFSNEWETKTLGDVGKIIGGGTPETINQEFWNGNINWFTPTELKTKYVKESIRTISELGLKKSSAKILPKGTLLLSSRATVGDISIALCECSTNQGFQSIIVNGKNLNEFVYYWLTKNKKELVRKACGSTFLEISKTEISKIKITLPDLKEQQKIADFLVQIDVRIEKLTKKKELLEKYKKGVMQKIFNQEIRFKNDNGDNYSNWKIKKLGDIGKIIGGGTPETINSEFWNGGINWFTPTELKTKYVRESIRTISELGLKKSSAKILPKGTILLSSRATVGDASIALCECSTNQGFQSIVVNSTNSNEFIYYWLTINKKEILRKSSGSTFLEISKTEISALKINLPCFEEQQKIANFLTEIDKKINLTEKQLNGTKQYKKGLLQQMFI